MSQTIINNEELLLVITKRVGTNGQISIGKKHTGKEVTAYVCLSKNMKDCKGE